MAPWLGLAQVMRNPNSNTLSWLWSGINKKSNEWYKNNGSLISTEANSWKPKWFVVGTKMASSFLKHQSILTQAAYVG